MVVAKTNRGFTVIEVILFLAVASLMMAGVLVGIGSSVNSQRYNEALYSFEDFIKGQYSLTDNVRNNRPADQVCSPSSISLTPGSPEPRGTSECTIAGRLISTTDGREITSRPVFATAGTYDTSGDEDLLLSSLDLIAGPVDLVSDDETFNVPWQTYIYTDRDNKTTSNEFSILILNLPTNGLTRTYFQDSAATSTMDDFWTAGLPGDLILCVEPDGLISTNPLGVRVVQGATNSNSVQRITAGDNQC